ncbi:SDR family NAD(P)-dependent oxidoreductase [Ekhidna sp. To15]|uniref:SDR family NAD(P)-dependent oxidoreductase n=1 Tax=Ekhidna sp. To15 TaxID=3395267 RepID=UPI003F51EA24
MAKSKNILITGASTGIGYDLAKIFVENGYTVYGSVRKQTDADRLSKQLGSDFKPVLFDVTDHNSVDLAAEKLHDEIGTEGLGGLINNAGIAIGGPMLDLTIADYRQQFEVNVIGLIKVTKAFLPLLGARANHPSEPGRIVQISSVAGKVGMPFMSPYAGSKHAVEGLSESLRRELQLFGIKVIVIGPGPIKTPIWDKGISDDANLRFKDSPYAESINIFQNSFVKDAIKNGWTSEKAARIIFNAFEKKNPKARYALVPQRFKNWTLPRLLPSKALDKFVRQKLKLKPRK